MDDRYDQSRSALLVLLEQAIGEEARADQPSGEDLALWMFGNVGWTEPDEHGWIAPTQPYVWMPRALCLWHITICVGGTISTDRVRHPAFKLHPWPEIEEAVGDFLFAYPWLIA